MENKTLDQLREMARTAGLRGYSGLRKKQLIELLKKQKAQAPTGVSAPRTTAKKTAKSTPARVNPAATAGPAKPPVPSTTSDERSAIAEQHVESTKFEMTPPGASIAARAAASDLQEDIERLPPPNESVLCLLPQKPGVVHAYWALQSGATTKELRLRLCRMSGNTIELMSEIKIAGERGHWYFNVPTSHEPGNLIAQLGSYDEAGKFVSAIRRGVARIPSLYASAQTDRRWWISEEEFREMYVRAGGVRVGAKLLWPGSFSSPNK